MSNPTPQGTARQMSQHDLSNQQDKPREDAAAPSSQSGSRGVLIHEWIEPRGGAEKVLDALAETFPKAPIRALWNDAPQRYETGRVTESWLASTRLRRSKSLALPFMETAWRNMGHSEAEWILASSHLFAHHARFSGPAADAKRYAYVHTPARYLWEPDLDVRGQSKVLQAAAVPFKQLDFRRAQSLDKIAANSEFVKQRIARCWHRDSTVIYPPVDVSAFTSSLLDELSGAERDLLDSLPADFVLGASRFVPYKKLDTVIDLGAAARVPVVLAGSGPGEEFLRSYAEESEAEVHFILSPSHALLRELYARAIAYVFPPVEDFGIMPVEAMASGTPVIANAVGGARESVVQEQTGYLLESFDPVSAREAVDALSSIDRGACVERARSFAPERFKSEIQEWVAA